MKKIITPLWTLGFLAAALCAANGQDLKETFERVNPSVVKLFVIERIPTVVPVEGTNRLTTKSMKHGSLGSGVLISEDGLVLTAAHVIQTADTVVVEFLGEKKVVGKVIASEPAADIALLQLEKVPDGATPVALGDSDPVSVGEEVFVIGAPYGIDHVLTVGHVSARHSPKKVLTDFELGEFFQTDAAINMGNSGGPMFNTKGEVIGIVSSTLSISGGFEGLGFAVTSNTAKKLLLDQHSPWSGVRSHLLSGKLVDVFNVPQSAGLLIERVALGSPADSAGVRGGKIAAVIDGQEILLGGDIVLSVAGVPISPDYAANRDKIKKALMDIPLGGEIPIIVLRSGKVIKLATARKSVPPKIAPEKAPVEGT